MPNSNAALRGIPPAANGAWTRRRMRLHGDQVTAWFTDRGWTVRDLHVANRHAFVDELTTASVTARRIWHTPLSLYANSRHPSETLSVWLQADGTLNVAPRFGETLRLDPGSSFFYRTRPVSLANDRPTARVEISVDHHELDGQNFPRVIEQTDSPMWVSLTSVVNAVLNADDIPDAHTLSLLALAIETLVQALWFESAAPMTSAPPRPPSDTFTRALELIRTHASNSTFNITNLAAELQVSRAHVTRIFREQGTTPSRTLKHERLLRARRFFALDPHADHDTVATTCGFPSARALREALRSTRPTPRQ